MDGEASPDVSLLSAHYCITPLTKKKPPQTCWLQGTGGVSLLPLRSPEWNKPKMSTLAIKCYNKVIQQLVPFRPKLVGRETCWCLAGTGRVVWGRGDEKSNHGTRAPCRKSQACRYIRFINVQAWEARPQVFIESTSSQQIAKLLSVWDPTDPQLKRVWGLEVRMTRFNRDKVKPRLSFTSSWRIKHHIPVIIPQQPDGFC